MGSADGVGQERRHNPKLDHRDAMGARCGLYRRHLLWVESPLGDLCGVAVLPLPVTPVSDRDDPVRRRIGRQRSDRHVAATFPGWSHGFVLDTRMIAKNQVLAVKNTMKVP